MAKTPVYDLPPSILTAAQRWMMTRSLGFRAGNLAAFLETQGVPVGKIANDQANILLQVEHMAGRFVANDMAIWVKVMT